MRASTMDTTNDTTQPRIAPRIAISDWRIRFIMSSIVVRSRTYSPSRAFSGRVGADAQRYTLRKLLSRKRERLGLEDISVGRPVALVAAFDLKKIKLRCALGTFNKRPDSLRGVERNVQHIKPHRSKALQLVVASVHH